jgi:hypothetical protein
LDLQPVEFEPIKDYLLIEAGITPFFDNSGHADWDFDLLFRRPFELSKRIEFEPGSGTSGVTPKLDMCHTFQKRCE